MKKSILTIFLLSTSILVYAHDQKQVDIKTTTLNAQDHNSTRSNRGSIKVIDDTNSNKPNVLIQNQSQPLKKGRNPQTGKEINIKKDKRIGRNPQTGKEINAKDK